MCSRVPEEENGSCRERFELDGALNARIKTRCVQQIKHSIEKGPLKIFSSKSGGIVRNHPAGTER